MQSDNFDAHEIVFADSCASRTDQSSRGQCGLHEQLNATLLNSETNSEAKPWPIPTHRLGPQILGVLVVLLAWYAALQLEFFVCYLNVGFWSAGSRSLFRLVYYLLLKI